MYLKIQAFLDKVSAKIVTARAKTKRPWLYSGAAGVHATMHYSGSVNPFVIILPTLMLGHVWVIQSVVSERKYISVRIGWLLWSFELYIRSRKVRARQND